MTMPNHQLLAIHPGAFDDGDDNLLDVADILTPLGVVAVTMPSIPEAASPAVREGMARRRLVIYDGRCPCGATFDLVQVAPGLGVVRVEHVNRCPADDRVLAAALTARAQQ